MTKAYFLSSQEALRDLNEELEESHLQTEHDLREELDMTNNKKREVSKYSQFISVASAKVVFILRRRLHFDKINSRAFTKHI